MKASDTSKLRKPLHYGWIIVFTGVFVPWINKAAGVEGWRIAWVSMGLICLISPAVSVPGSGSVQG